MNVIFFYVYTMIDTIIGGIEPTPSVTIFTGGSRKVERVVNDNATYEVTKQLADLKYVGNNIKDILHVVDMSLPVTFNKTIYYDTGHPPKRMPNHDRDMKILTALKNRINVPISTTISQNIESFKLKQIMEITMLDFITWMSKYIKKHNRSENMRPIKITNDMLPLIDNKSKLFQVVSVTKHNSGLPSNLVDVILFLLNKIEKTHPRRGMWDTLPPTIRYPILNDNIKKQVDAIKKKLTYKTTHDIKKGVTAIVLINHILLPHLREIELYYVAVTRAIQDIHRRVKWFLTHHPQSAP